MQRYKKTFKFGNENYKKAHNPTKIAGNAFIYWCLFEIIILLKPYKNPK
jgi:hypothetical protein